MAMGALELYKERNDTLTNHDLPTSGNGTFSSIAERFPMFPLEEELAERQVDFRAMGTVSTEASGYASIYSTIGALIPEPGRQSQLKAQELLVAGARLILAPGARAILTPTPIPVSVNLRSLIDQETSRLDVLADAVGPALLAVLHRCGPLSIERIIAGLNMQEDDVVSYMTNLKRNRLVVRIEERYSITEDGIAFVRELELTE